MQNQDNLFNTYKENMEKFEEQNSSIPINSDKLWKTISDKLDQKETKKKRIFFWPVSIAAGILAIIGISYFLNLNENKISTNTGSIVLEDKNRNDRENENEKKHIANGIQLPKNNDNDAIDHSQNSIADNEVILIKNNNQLASSNHKNIKANDVNTGKIKNENVIIENSTNDLQYTTIVQNTLSLDSIESNGTNRIRTNSINSLSNTSNTGTDNTNLGEITISTEYLKTNTSANEYTGSINVLSSTNSHNDKFSIAYEGKQGNTTINAEGQPGSSPGIQIRGTGSISSSNAPLLIVDGEVYTGDISQINPNDVENVQTLKDATATSLYGSRGVNGVIIINTKSKSGIKKRNFFQRILSPKKKNKSSSIQFTPSRPIKNHLPQESYAPIIENDFKLSHIDPLSTFSIDVDKASFSNIRRMINNNTVIPPDAVRVEEFINYFKYKYHQPKSSHPIHLDTELATCPWNSDHYLLRIGLQGKEIQKELLPPSNLVFLIDVSGSMNTHNKLPLVKESMLTLLEELRPQDYVSIVTYANGVNVVLESTSAKNKMAIIEAIEYLNAGGGTSGHDGLIIAYEQAMKNFMKNGNNRIVLATDGDFNIGPSSISEMEKLIEEKRKSNIFLTCLGFGMGNYKDNMLKSLSTKGNGNYAYINDINEANYVLNHEFSSTMFVIAKDVKLQVEFNPEVVQGYRLVGYEKRIMNHQDFSNDKVDAGDMGAGHQVTALYEIIPVGINSRFLQDTIPLKYSSKIQNKQDNSVSEIATIQFRYKNKDSDKSQLLSHIVNHSIIKNTSAEFKLATSLAWYAQWLRDSKYVSDNSQKDILKYMNQITEKDYLQFVKEIKDNINTISEYGLRYTFPQEDIVKTK